MPKSKGAPGVYGITCLFTKRWYIGASVDIQRRIAQHLRDCEKDAKMHKKYGPSWDFRYKGEMGKDYALFGKASFSGWLIEHIKDPKKFAEREQYWIRYYASKKHGYNRQMAGPHHTWK